MVYNGPIRVEQEGGREDVTMEAEVVVATSQGLQVPPEAGKDKETDCPRECPERNTALPTHFGLGTSSTVK